MSVEEARLREIMRLRQVVGAIEAELAKKDKEIARLSKFEAIFEKAQVIELKGGGGFIGILAGDVLAVLGNKEEK